MFMCTSSFFFNSFFFLVFAVVVVMSYSCLLVLVLSSFISFLDSCLYSNERKKDIGDLGGWGRTEFLGVVGERKTIIRMYCINALFSIKTNKGKKAKRKYITMKYFS